MGCTSNFFIKKNEWSKLKDKLLENYLTPYLEKIKILNKEIVIFDCFAGKGKFDDGLDGSPLIILNRILHSNASSIAHAYFIEKEYGDILEKNLRGYGKKYTVIKDSYELTVEYIKLICKDKNVFLYIDPYGIKTLDFKYFNEFNISQCNTIELLLNFNTFGFLREGCRLLNMNHTNSCEDDTIEFEKDDSNTIENMNSIANGDYWRKLIEKHYTEGIDLKIIETEFAEMYKKELKTIFKHVIQIPIKDKVTNRPKYRMFYGSNSDHGLFLMVDEMHKAWSEILKIDRKGQGEFFEENSESGVSRNLKVFVEYNIEGELLKILEKEKQITMREYFVRVINASGITFSISEYRAIIKILEDSKIIEVIRENKMTITGRESHAFDFEKQKIVLKKG